MNWDAFLHVWAVAGGAVLIFMGFMLVTYLAARIAWPLFLLGLVLSIATFAGLVVPGA